MKNPFDFDGGFGIGGLARHEEQESIPTVEQIKHAEQKQIEAQLHRCRICGASEMDGAMFTTDPDSGICDDCY